MRTERGRGRAAQDEEGRDDALGGFRTTVIADLLRTLTIQLEGTTGAEGQSVQNCTLFKTTARWIGGLLSAPIGGNFSHHSSLLTFPVVWRSCGGRMVSLTGHA